MQDLQVSLNGDATRASRYEPVPLSLTSRIGFIIGGSWDSQAAVTPNYRDSLAVAKSELQTILQQLRAISGDLQQLEASLESDGAPWTPGRLPE